MTWDEEIQIRLKPREFSLHTAVDLELELLNEGWRYEIAFPPLLAVL